MAVLVAADRMGWVFFFFNNRLGCAGSLLVSVIGTAVVIVIVMLVTGR